MVAFYGEEKAKAALVFDVKALFDVLENPLGKFHTG